MLTPIEKFAVRKIFRDRVGCYVGGRLYLLKFKFRNDDPRIPAMVRKIDAAGQIDLSNWILAK